MITLFLIIILISDNPVVAFSVTANYFEPFGYGNTVKFVSEITSVGGGWNSGDNTFYCPHPGVYLFALTLYKHVLVTTLTYILVRVMRILLTSRTITITPPLPQLAVGSR